MPQSCRGGATALGTGVPGAAPAGLAGRSREQLEAAARVLERSRSWTARPVLARAVRLVTVLLPVAVSTAVVVVIDRALPAVRGAGGLAEVAVLDAAVVLCTVSAVERLARRLLPLATLLSLSLVFPDRAPQRFGIALRANSPSRIRARLAATRDGRRDAASAADDLLTYLAALSRHDRATRGHCERVRAFVDLLGEEMGLSRADQDRLRWAALLHDVGKLRVPGPLLRKPGKPTDSEWTALRRHPVDGAALVRPLAGWLGPWAAAVEQHHERYDGTGYPKGLAASDISLGGRILAVADAYEVMVTSRPYKRPVRPDAARRELVACAGTQFDPDVVRAFLRISLGDLRRVMGPLGLLAQVPVLATVPRAGVLVEMAGQQAAGALTAAAGAGAIAVAGTIGAVHALPAGSAPARVVATPSAAAGRAVPGTRPAARPASEPAAHLAATALGAAPSTDGGGATRRAGAPQDGASASPPVAGGAATAAAGRPPASAGSSAGAASGEQGAASTAAAAAAAGGSAAPPVGLLGGTVGDLLGGAAGSAPVGSVGGVLSGVASGVASGAGTAVGGVLSGVASGAGTAAGGVLPGAGASLGSVAGGAGAVVGGTVESLLGSGSPAPGTGGSTGAGGGASATPPPAGTDAGGTGGLGSTVTAVGSAVDGLLP